MNQKDFKKKILVSVVTHLELLVQMALYAAVWFGYYYPKIIQYDTKLYFKGFVLILGIYLILLYLFFNTYGGLKIGFMKSMDMSLSQMFGLICTNVVTYFLLSLIHGWLVPVVPLLQATLVQVAVAVLWILLSNRMYKKMFPPRKLLLIYGDRSIDDILFKFATRKDKFDIRKCIKVSEGTDKILDEIDSQYDGVVLWDIPTADRNRLLKYCYSQSIRIYMMPKISDVIMMGSEALHLFDTPIVLTRETALTVEQRFIKRCIDVICSVILLVLAFPFMLVTAIVIKAYDGGPVLYKQIRCTRDAKEFYILKFRSMRVDAEKDGVARLAAKNDSRITPIGKFIRAVRIDELPQLINILKGEMSFIGPRPERPEIIAQYVQEMPEFAFRTKVKAGLAGYAQVYGKYNTTPYDKLKLDLTYIENYSVWLDIRLMLLTLKILLSPESTEGVDSTQVTAMKAGAEEERK